MLSSKLLDILRGWWRVERPKEWLFPGDFPGQHITVSAVQQAGLLARLLNRANCDVLAWKIAWEEPLLGSLDSPPATQDIQELRREHRVEIGRASCRERV